MAEAGELDVQTLDKTVARLFGIHRRSDRVVAAGQQERRRGRVQRGVKVRIDRAPRPELAHGPQAVQLHGSQIRSFDALSVDPCQIVERHVLGADDAVVHAVRDDIPHRPAGQ